MIIMKKVDLLVRLFLCLRFLEKNSGWCWDIIPKFAVWNSNFAR